MSQSKKPTLNLNPRGVWLGRPGSVPPPWGPGRQSVLSSSELMGRERLLLSSISCTDTLLTPTRHTWFCPLHSTGSVSDASSPRAIFLSCFLRLPEVSEQSLVCHCQLAGKSRWGSVLRWPAPGASVNAASGCSHFWLSSSHTAKAQGGKLRSDPLGLFQKARAPHLNSLFQLSVFPLHLLFLSKLRERP